MTAPDIVLIVDDQEDARELLALIARQHGFEAWMARDCAEAIPLARRAGERLALVLLDYFMPGMEPVRCCREIVANARAGTPVVLVTAALDPAERARELGLEHFVGKPFDLDAFDRIWRLAREEPATARR
jgi:CheY-like chemotaxis protein